MGIVFLTPLIRKWYFLSLAMPTPTPGGIALTGSLGPLSMGGAILIWKISPLWVTSLLIAYGRVEHGFCYGSDFEERWVGTDFSERQLQYLQLTTVCVHHHGPDTLYANVLRGLTILEENSIQNNIVEGSDFEPLDLVPIEIAIMSTSPFSVRFLSEPFVESVRSSEFDPYEGYPHLQNKYVAKYLVPPGRRQVLHAGTKLVRTLGRGDIRMFIHSVYTKVGPKPWPRIEEE